MKDFTSNIDRTYYLIIGQAEDIDGETINILYHNGKSFTKLNQEDIWPSPRYEGEFYDHTQKAVAEETCRWYNELSPTYDDFYKNGRNFKVYEIDQSIATETYGRLAT